MESGQPSSPPAGHGLPVVSTLAATSCEAPPPIGVVNTRGSGAKRAHSCSLTARASWQSRRRVSKRFCKGAALARWKQPYFEGVSLLLLLYSPPLEPCDPVCIGPLHHLGAVRRALTFLQTTHHHDDC